MLDLDAAQGQLEEVWRNGWYPNSTVSSGVLLKTMDALIAELRKLREENERLLDLSMGFMEQNRVLKAEHARICNEHALLVQESGREGRELDRLEGLLRAWATLEEEWKGNNERYRGTDLIKAKDAVYAEGLKLIRERT